MVNIWNTHNFHVFLYNSIQIGKIMHETLITQFNLITLSLVSFSYTIDFAILIAG